MRYVRVVLPFILLATWAPLQAQQSMPPSKLYAWGVNALTSGRPRVHPKDAVSYFHIAADQGYPPAQVMMGYLSETGTPAGLVDKDPAQAIDWYKKSAAQDNPLGEWLLGRMIYTGTGTSRDLNEAGKWFQKAASHNDPFGQYLLDGQNYAGAAQSFRSAAMQGLPQAQEQLGMLLKNGQGVTADKSEAYTWLLVSSDAGNKAAGSALPELEGQLTSEQLQPAKAKAHQLEMTVSRATLARGGCTGWPSEFDAIPGPPPVQLQSLCQ